MTNMKKHLPILVATILCFGLSPAFSQFGPRPGGPAGLNLSVSMAKLFGDNSAFTANLEIRAGQGADLTIVPGILSATDGKVRFEMDMSQMKGGHIPPSAVSQMKAMGMDKIVMIARPDKKITWLLYPGLQAYAEMPNQDPDAGKAASDFTAVTTELGRETVDGHACTKNKVVVSDKDGNKHESTVWNAPDLKNFPVQIAMAQDGNVNTMLFKNVKLEKPDSGQFDPPSSYTKYENMQALIQQEMMKHISGGMAAPPH